MLNEDYDISITGRQLIDGENGEINLFTTGAYTERGNVRFISYKEYDEEEPHKSHTAVLRVEDGKVTLTRAGSETRLILEKDKRHLCLYDTGFGSMTLGVFTSAIDSTLAEAGGELRVKYTLDIDSNFSSSNEINVLVKRRRKIRKTPPK